jgi:DNA-binding protein H-NS
MKINLKTLSVAELKTLSDEIEIEMELRSREERQKLVQEFRDKAKTLGMSLEELMAGQKAKGAKVRVAGKVAAKYANPADKSQTWTGRGKQPRWVAAALAAGKKLDDLKI